MELLLLAALGAFVVGFVLRPVFRSTETTVTGGMRSEEWEQLTDQKERLLAALKDLEFEHKTGKLSDDDYQRVKADDVAVLAGIMERMDALTVPAKDEPLEPAAKPEKPPKSTCASCGRDNPPGAKFCLLCGKPFPIPVECSQCGTTLPAEAKFCIECGTEVRE